MISVLSGNLFESKAQTWVNTVNCVGVMGKGVALGFKERFPEMFADYQRRCERGEVRLGRPYLFKQLVGPWIVNFPTKQHWRRSQISRTSSQVSNICMRTIRIGVSSPSPFHHLAAEMVN